MTDNGIRVRGLERLTRTLDAATDDIADMTAAHTDAGKLVLARSHPPRDTGALAASRRAIPSKDMLELTATVRYAPFVHNGNRGRRPQPFLTDPINHNHTALEAIYVDHLDDSIAQVKGI